MNILIKNIIRLLPVVNTFFVPVQHRVILIVKRPPADEFTGKITLRSKPEGLLTRRIEDLQRIGITHVDCLPLQICVTLWKKHI